MKNSKTMVLTLLLVLMGAILNSVPAYGEEQEKRSPWSQMWSEKGGSRIDIIKADIQFNTKAEYVINVEVPGINNLKVDIEKKDFSVWVRGERIRPKETDEDKPVVIERTYGQFQRRFLLPAFSDMDRLKVRVEGGILRISAPPKHDITTRKRKLAAEFNQRKQSIMGYFQSGITRVYVFLMISYFNLTQSQMIVSDITSTNTSPIAPECRNPVFTLFNCRQFAGGKSPIPSDNCCQNLQQAYRDHPQCPCFFINGTATPPSSPFNVTRAVKLPGLCHIKANTRTCFQSSDNNLGRGQFGGLAAGTIALLLSILLY